MNRKSYGEEARKTLVQQTAAISKLKSDNQSLKEQLNLDTKVE